MDNLYRYTAPNWADPDGKATLDSNDPRCNEKAIKTSKDKHLSIHLEGK